MAKIDMDDPNYMTKMWKWLFVQEGKNAMAQHILHTLDKLCKDKKISEDALVDIVKSIADCQRNEVKQYEVFIRSKDDSELK